MASPTKITYTFSFTDFQTHNADAPLPGDEVDIALREVKRASDQTIDRLNMIQRDDGQLANKSVGTEQMKDDVYGVFQGYVGQAQTHAQNAHTSEINAKTSETNSKASENSSRDSKDAAALSAAAALASENSSRDSRDAAALSAAGALASENSSRDSKDAAALSAAAALSSENKSKTSETNAKASEQAAAQSAAHADTAVAHLAGGQTGQAMLKRSDSDFDYGWYSIPGGGDMLAAIYDFNSDGKVNAADLADRATLADSVDWANVTTKPAFGTAALANVADFATSAQGIKADNALAAADLLAAPVKAAPVDNDTLVALDSEDSGKIKRFTWLAIKNRLKAYFDPIYQAALGFTPLNKAGDTINGALKFGNGSLATSGDVIAVRADSNTGAVFLGTGHYLYWNGNRFDLNGPVRADGSISAVGVVYAGDGTTYLNTDGNLNGAVWNPWGSPWAKDAIDARIESRAEAWARAVGSGYVARDRITSAGFVGGDVNQPYFLFDGWSIEVLVSDRNLMGKIAYKTHVDELGVYALAQYYTGGGDNLGPNQPINGSQLKYASAFWGSGGTLPGTWNLHGHIKRSTGGELASQVSLFVRKY